VGSKEKWREKEESIKEKRKGRFNKATISNSQNNLGERQTKEKKRERNAAGSRFKSGNKYFKNPTQKRKMVGKRGFGRQAYIDSGRILDEKSISYGTRDRAKRHLGLGMIWND